MSSADLSALLKSLPANSIQKIEVLRNPSAKYDASSSGGILNIVLKKGVKLGNNGSVNVAYFQGVYATGTAGVTFNHQGDKWNYYTNYQFTKKNSFEQLNSIRGFTADSLLINQQSYTTYPSLSHYFNGGTDRTFSNGITIGFDTRLTSNNNSSNAKNNLTFGKIGTEGFVGNNLSLIGNKNQSYYWSNTANLKYKIDTTGSEWNNVFEYTKNSFNNEQQYINTLPFPVGVIVKGDGNNTTRKNQFSFQSDLTLKLKGAITLETGLKLSFGKSENESLYFKDTGTRFVDAFQTNTYKFNDNIHAAYFQMSKTIWGFIIKPGVRFEHTDIRGVQSVPRDTSFSIRRNDLFPYLFIKHKLFKIFGQTLMASGTVRRTIKRPYYEALNPFPKFIDQYLYEQGNPTLKPQFTTNYELSVTFNDIPVASVGVNQTKDIFTGVIYQDDITKIAYRTFDNLGKNKEIYARLIAGIPPGGKYFFYIGGLYNFNAYRGFFQGQPFNYDIGSFTFFTFHEYKYSNTLSLSMQGFLRSRGLQQLYELETFGGMFLSANKSILKRKANLILSISDVLRTNRVTFNFNRNQQQIEGNRINDTRRVGLTFRYNFGIKPKEEKKGGFEGAAENANP
jgi:outer membrane receptor protein involved in Fe transport